MFLFISNIIYSFLIAFGVIFGASSFAGFGALINNHPPLKTMIDLANSIKIWAVATALGGPFHPLNYLKKEFSKESLVHYVSRLYTYWQL